MRRVLKRNAMKALAVMGFFVSLAASAGVVLAESSTADAVPVYDSTQVAFDRYTVVKRLGVEGLQSAFWISGYGDLARARQALVNEAARLGADGVINLQCLSQTDSLMSWAGYYCYGNAIRITNERAIAK